MRSLVLCWGLLLAAPAASTEAFDGPQQSALQAAVDVILDSEPHAALSIGVQHGERVWLVGQGAAPQTTTFRIASITKTFTALMAVQLAAEGKLDLDADIRKLVPSFPAKQWPVTARGLLSHTSGIDHYRGLRDGMTSAMLDTEGSLALFADRPLLSAPGAQFRYSSYGYVLLGAAIEAASGKSFEENLLQRILLPVGMTRTGLEHTGRKDADAVGGFRLRAGKVVPADRIDISSRFSSGGMRSTASDLLLYARALMEATIVDEKIWLSMIEPVVTTDGRRADYGMGFAVYPQRGHVVVAHAGGQPGTSSLWLMIPDERLAIVLLSNLEGHAPVLSQVAAAICELLLEGGVPRRKLYAEDPVDEVLYDGLNRIYSHGLASTKKSAPLRMKGGAPSSSALAAAFSRVALVLQRSTLALDIEGGKRIVDEIHHPREGSAAVWVGKEMARVVGGDLARFHAAGPLPFFAAYLDVCIDNPTACPHPLPAGLASEVRRLASAGSGSVVVRAEHLAAADDDGLTSLLQPLRQWVKTPLHPDVSSDLVRAAAAQQKRGAVSRAQQLRDLDLALHPRLHAQAVRLPSSSGPPLSASPTR